MMRLKISVVLATWLVFLGGSWAAQDELDARRLQYKIPNGVTIGEIAAQFGIDLQELKRCNGGTDALQAGKVLTLPFVEETYAQYLAERSTSAEAALKALREQIMQLEHEQTDLHLKLERADEYKQYLEPLAASATLYKDHFWRWVSPMSFLLAVVSALNIFQLSRRKARLARVRELERQAAERNKEDATGGWRPNAGFPVVTPSGPSLQH